MRNVEVPRNPMYFVAVARTTNTFATNEFQGGGLRSLGVGGKGSEFRGVRV